MRTILILTGIFLFLLVAMTAINLTGIIPTHEYLKEQCTRYCHDHHCIHFEAKLNTQDSFASKIQLTYQTTIQMLKHNPLGLSYQTINLLIFVIGFPLLIFLLSFNLIRKWKKS
ncbi:MAG: hypothetical protein AAFP82_14395 [Bacteroidota bacterium]